MKNAKKFREDAPWCLVDNVFVSGSRAALFRAAIASGCLIFTHPVSADPGKLLQLPEPPSKRYR